MSDRSFATQFDFTTPASAHKLYTNLCFAVAVIVALLFIAYLIRCYFQEYRRMKKIRRRCRSASPSSYSIPAPLTFARPGRKSSPYTVAPVIHYTVTASSSGQSEIGTGSTDAAVLALRSNDA